jgi:hypothetical protein
MSHTISEAARKSTSNMKGQCLTTTKDGKIIVTVPLSSSMVKAKGSQKNTKGKTKAPVMKKKTKTKNTNNSKTTKGTQVPPDAKPRGQGDTGKSKTISKAGGTQLVLTPKMKTFEPRFEQAITFKFNAKDTNQEDKGEGNAFWLRQAGYHEEEITKHFLDTFKRVFCRRFKPAAEVLRISEEDQTWNYYWVRKKNLSSDMIGFLTRWLTFVEKLKKNKNVYFERIGATSLKQRKLDPLAKRAPEYKIIQNLYDESNKFFDQEGLYEEFQADPDKNYHSCVVHRPRFQH